MTTILVIGDVMTDIVVRPEEPLAVGADTRATIRQVPGGSGANQAAWLAGEGVAVRFAGRVGRGDLAAQQAMLAAAGVDARLGADDILPTGQIVTLVSESGERSFLTDRGANLALCRDDLPDSLLDGIDLVSVSGYALFAETPRTAVLALLEEAKRRDIPFSIDPASYSFLEEVGPDNFLAWTRGAHFAFPNEDEARVLTGTHEADAQLAVLTGTYETVVIKRGAAGAVAADKKSGKWISVPAPRVAVVDPSGAGDAFLAGFLAACLRGEGLSDAVARGAALGAQAVMHFGGRPA